MYALLVYNYRFLITLKKTFRSTSGITLNTTTPEQDRLTYLESNIADVTYNYECLIDSINWRNIGSRSYGKQAQYSNSYGVPLMRPTSETAIYIIFWQVSSTKATIQLRAGTKVVYTFEYDLTLG